MDAMRHANIAVPYLEGKYAVQLEGNLCAILRDFSVFEDAVLLRLIGAIYLFEIGE